MQQRTLGTRTVGAIGLGGMPMSIEGRPDAERSIATIRAALDAGVSPQQIALAWELALAPVVIPIPGASRPESIIDSARATDVVLTGDELAALSGTD